MPRPGPKPAPRALRLMRGERSCRINDQEPEAPAASLEPPAWLGEGVAREKWAELAPMLAEMGVLAAPDADMLGRYCVAFERYLAAIEACRIGLDVVQIRDAKGQVVGTQVSAYASLARRLADQLDRTAAEFGMSPSSRTRIKGSASTDRRDPLSQWLRDNPVEARA